MNESYRIRHLTRYRYASTVTLSQHAAHLRPRNLMRQTCHSSKLIVNPTPASISERSDFFGNTVTLFTVESGHNELEVISESQVTVSPPAPPPAEITPPWEDAVRLLRRPRGGEALQASAFLYASPMIPRLPEMHEFALPSFPPERPLLEAAIDLTSRIYREFTYDPEATNNATPLSEVLASRHGVCQDFAHVQIAALRSLGLAARYISGYIRTYHKRPDGSDDPDGLIGGDASHAWVSLWIPGNGWVDLDPTNDKLALDEHITVAWGRDFGDVSPIKGVMVGGGDQNITVSVAVIPEAPVGTTPVAKTQRVAPGA